MEVKQFLERLLHFGIENRYFLISEIGKLDKTACPNLKTEVIDFDQTKEKVVSKYQLITIKSCDALKILLEKGQVDFIEMKRFKEFIHRNLNTKNFEDKVQTQVNNFDFTSKIKDSIFILDLLINSQMTGSERKLYNQIPKNFIILTDIEIQKNPLETIALSLDFLAQTSSNIEHIVASICKDELDKLSDSLLYNIQKPILLACKDFDTRYA